VYYHVSIQAQNLRRKSCCTLENNINNDFTIQKVSKTCVQRVRYSDPPYAANDAVINKAPWQCVPLQHDRLLQLTNGFKLPAVVDSLLLLLMAPKWRNPSDLNPGC